jgi:hypothetical protein
MKTFPNEKTATLRAFSGKGASHFFFFYEATNARKFVADTTAFGAAEPNAVAGHFHSVAS